MCVCVCVHVYTIAISRCYCHSLFSGVSVGDLMRSRSPIGPHRPKLAIICLTFRQLPDFMVEWVKGNQREEGCKEINIYIYIYIYI